MAKPIGRALNRIALATVAGLLAASVPGRAAGEGPGRVVLENSQLRIEIDPANGAIARILDKEGRIDLVPAADLADNFHLLLRDAEKKETTILGRKQRLSKVSRQGDDALELRWNGPLTDAAGGNRQVNVRMVIRLTGPSLEFRFFLDNQTAGKVAQAWYPVVGGLLNFGRETDRGETFVMAPSSSAWIKKIALPLDGLDARYPGQMNMSYSSVYNAKAKRAMYFASHDTVARLKHYRYFEQDSPAGKDVFAAIEHVPFTPPGKSFEGSPVVLRFYDGGWEAAGPIYREWFQRTFGLMDPSRSWIRRHSFFQDTRFICPEGALNYTFKDIPRWAKDARDCGITSVLITGWQRGGHDNGYPYYEINPRLGSYEDLKRGLEACHKMGVRVYFFVNYQPAMVDADWFKKELRDYLEIGEDGGLQTQGYAMGTLWARMGHPKVMASVDPGFPAYRRALIRYFLKLVEAGADGVHVDKMFPMSMNFNPRCELGPDTSPWEGVIQLTRDFLAEARKIKPDFAMSFECNWDRMLEFGDSIWWVGNMSIVRRVFPEMIETREISAAYDYLGVNAAVCRSEVGLVDPMTGSRSVGWPPFRGMARYIGEVKRIQDRLSEAVFYGELLGHAQIQLQHEPEEKVEYNVFRGLTTGKRVCIFSNAAGEDRCQGIECFAGRPGGGARIHIPFTPPREAALPLKLTIPAERIVFVEELPDFHGGKPIVLENRRYRVEVGRANGAVTRVLDKTAGLDLIREPRLAGNFKFTLPLPGKEPWDTIDANYIVGKDQPLSAFKLEGETLTLLWDKPLRSRTGEQYDAAVSMQVKLTDEAVRFTLRIDNRTPYRIGEVFFPILGGVTGLGNKHEELRATQLVLPAKKAIAASDVFVRFDNLAWFGDQGAEHYALYPRDLREPWMALYCPKLGRSVYLASHDPADRSRVLYVEMLPGLSGATRWDGNWPRSEELQGLPAGLMFSLVDFPYHPPGKVYEPAPVVLQAHAGGWQESEKIYRRWKASR